MGCDIHCFLEYKKIGYDRWSCFGGGDLHPGRNYRMFSLMAGVRSVPSVPIIPPKGIPEGIAWETKEKLYVRIRDEDELDDGEGYTTDFNTAMRWVCDDQTCDILVDKNGFPTHVSGPDWHSHSWLTKAEYEACLDNMEVFPDVGYAAMLSVMNEYENARYETRLVFWFDN